VKISSVDRKLRMVVETPATSRCRSSSAPRRNARAVRRGGTERRLPAPSDFREGRLRSKVPPSSGSTLRTSRRVERRDRHGGGSSVPGFEEGGGVTLVFKGAVAEKGLLRRIDARKFDIPVKAIAPSGGKNGVTVAVAFAPGAAYTVERETARSWWRSRRV